MAVVTMVAMEVDLGVMEAGMVITIMDIIIMNTVIIMDMGMCIATVMKAITNDFKMIVINTKTKDDIYNVMQTGLFLIAAAGKQ